MQTDEQRKELERLSRGRRVSVRLAQRASMSEATGLSESTTGRIWKEHGLKPHLVETFKLSKAPKFVEKLRDIVSLYH